MWIFHNMSHNFVHAQITLKRNPAKIKKSDITNVYYTFLLRHKCLNCWKTMRTIQIKIRVRIKIKINLYNFLSNHAFYKQPLQ